MTDTDDLPARLRSRERTLVSIPDAGDGGLKAHYRKPTELELEAASRIEQLEAQVAMQREALRRCVDPMHARVENIDSEYREEAKADLRAVYDALASSPSEWPVPVVALVREAQCAADWLLQVTTGTRLNPYPLKTAIDALPASLRKAAEK